MTGDLQCEIRLDRTADFERTARKHGPATMVTLMVEHISGSLFGPIGLAFSEEREQQVVLRLEDRVAL